MSKTVKYLLVTLVVSALIYSARAIQLGGEWSVWGTIFDDGRAGLANLSWAGWAQIITWNIFCWGYVISKTDTSDSSGDW